MLSTNLLQFLQKAIYSKPKYLSAATAAIGTPVFTGTGLNDLSKGGTFNVLVDHVYTIIIDGNGTPDTFKWKKDNGSFTTGVAITGSAQTLSEGVTITFAATTGHTIGDQWVVTVTAGVAIASAVAVADLLPIAVGSGAELVIYDGNNSNGTVLYDGLTANWSAGVTQYINKLLQNANGLYIALYASSTYPKMIVGYN
jgi:hypothetical protein